MKYSLVMRKDEVSEQVGERLRTLLSSSVYTENEPDTVIAIGGDGTMLEAFHRYHGTKPRFVCVGTGTLGFYADWGKEELGALAEHLEGEAQPCVSYPLLDVELTMESGEVVTLVALNELVIKSNTTSTFVMNTYLNGDLFQSFRGDGMICSTPSGSTAYNHSLMGSVIHPSLECVQVTELAAINNNIYRTLNRPLIMPKHHLLEGEILSDCHQVVAGIDNQKQLWGNVTSFRVSVSEEKVNFLRYRDFAFWTRVKDKFL